MSKSIKQYKQAMDNINISDSFLQRTETMLKEMSDTEKITVTAKKSNIRYIALAGCVAAAACTALVFTLKPDILTEDIAVQETVTESVSAVTEVTAVSETIYIDIENDDNIYAITPAAIPDEEVIEEAPVTKAEPAVEAPIPEEVPETATSAIQTPSVVAVNEADATTENVTRLYDVNFADMETELTSYLNSGLKADEAVYNDDDVFVKPAAPSGLNFLILDEKSAEKTVTMIADAVYTAPVVEGREVVEVEFAIDMTDLSSNEKAFEINICFDKTIQVITYGQDGETSTFYAVADHRFIEIEKYLFLKFGSNAQYEDFIDAQN